MKTQIDCRHHESGFIYIGVTRLGFAPKYVVDRCDADKADKNEPIALWRVANWPEPTSREIEACLMALMKHFPGRSIINRL